MEGRFPILPPIIYRELFGCLPSGRGKDHSEFRTRHYRERNPGSGKWKELPFTLVLVSRTSGQSRQEVAQAPVGQFPVTVEALGSGG